MLKRTKVVSLLAADKPEQEVLVKGWVRTRRDAKDFSFIELNDGSCLKNIQIIANNNDRFLSGRDRSVGRVKGRQPEI